jgi:hypothetical protein
MAISWQQFNAQVLAKLDIGAEYRELGIDITGTQPSAKGWLACRAVGREDKKPSAAINVGDGPSRGRYKDLGGTQDSLNLWDAAAALGPHADWREARRHYARKVGMGRSLPRSEKEDRPDEKFKWTQWNSLLVRGLIRAYPGITEESLLLCGARVGRYPANSNEPQYVVCLPAYGKELIDGGPRSFVAMAADGGKVLRYQGEGNPPLPLKRMNVGPSGLVGRHGLKQLAEHPESVEVIYKVEGISDLLAMQALIPPELRDTHLVVTNAAGASETTLPGEVAECLAGQNVVIVHDADQPGQNGAKVWIGALAGVAKTVVNLQLPFEVKENHGPDLRDWLLDGGGDD